VRARARPGWGLRIALGLAILATAIGLVIDMSGSAPRLAGSNHVFWPPQALADTVPGGGVLCTADTVLPGDAARMVMTIGSYGHPLPRITIDFTDTTGRRVATGVLAAGAHEGENVSLPLRYPHGPSAGGTLCLHVGGKLPMVFGGGPAAGTTIDGTVQGSSPSILYYRPGRESWWQLLGALDRRFGLGKSPIFGNWTLPAVVLAALLLWLGVVRLLVRELK
jgi:hypothetical protein